MAQVLTKVIREARDSAMTTRTDNGTTPAVTGPRQPPVRVKLRRINAELAKPYPPDGETRAWWGRLKRVLGTTSSAFVNMSLLQLQAAARLPNSGISEIALNAALAMIEAAAPRDEIEGALAVQMACSTQPQWRFWPAWGLEVVPAAASGGIWVGRGSAAEGLRDTGRGPSNMYHRPPR